MNKKLKGTLFAVAFVTATWMSATYAAAPKYEVRMYGFTGLFGVVGGFSLGVGTALDHTDDKYPTVKTYRYPHYKAGRAFQTIVANYKIDKRPIVLVGHSLGADAVIDIAEWLKALNIPVAAVFLYDPTPFVHCVPSNVLVAVLWRNTLPAQLGGGVTAPCTPSKDRAFQRYDVPDWHVAIDDRRDVHKVTIDHVGDVVHMTREMKGPK